MSRFWLVAISVVLCGAVAAAEEEQIVELELSGQAIDPDVLRYQLFPREAELKRGNAAAILLRLPWDQGVYMTQVFPKLAEWGIKPLHDPDWDTPEPEAASPRGLPSRFYDEMKRAAYRTQCDWDYPIGEVQPPHFILLPDVQGMRGFGAGLSSEARGHIARHKFAEAREAILVGLANTRHLSQTPFDVVQMCAASIQLMMLTRTAEMMGEPDSPNLYWALTTLPKDLLHVDRSADFEASMLTLAIPAIRDLDRPRDDDEWMRLSAQILELLETIDELPKTNFLEKLTRHQKLVATARRELPTMMNKTADSLIGMSDAEVIVRLLVFVHTHFDDRISAIRRLRPREAWSELKKVSAEMKEVSARTGFLHQASNESDWTNPIRRYAGQHNVERRIQQLRIIEAVRDHVATHDGRFPKTLGEITNVPIPLDPMTDEPFRWTLTDGQALLEPPPLPINIEESNDNLKRASGKSYLLKLRVQKPKTK